MDYATKERDKGASSEAARGHKKAAKPTLIVDVIATRDWDEGVNFTLQWEYPTNVWNSGSMIFARGDLDREIEYKLVDRTGLGLALDPTADDCIWVSGRGCPKTKPSSGSGKGQIGNKNRIDARKLSVTNKNDTTYKLYYALRFTGSQWTNGDGKSFGPYYNFDPEYRNSGGGGSNT